MTNTPPPENPTPEEIAAQAEADRLAHEKTNRKASAKLAPKVTERKCDRTLLSSGGKCGMNLLDDGMCPRCQPRAIAVGPDAPNTSGRIA